jgi:hypothetical protein
VRENRILKQKDPELKNVLGVIKIIVKYATVAPIPSSFVCASILTFSSSIVVPDIGLQAVPTAQPEVKARRGISEAHLANRPGHNVIKLFYFRN